MKSLHTDTSDSLRNLQMTTIGWVYCFENPSMPEIYKVGVTLRTPADRLFEANQSDTWRPPTPYSQVMAKRVRDAPAKEKRIHAILDDFGFRIHPRREFFNAPVSIIQQLFDLMDECTDATEAEAEAEVPEISEDADDTDASTFNKQFSDDIRRFLEDFRKENPTVVWLLSSHLYKKYTEWCEAKGVFPITLTLFGRLVITDLHLFRQRRSNGQHLYVGSLSATAAEQVLSPSAASPSSE